MLAAGLVEFGYRADSKNCLTFASRHSTDESFIRRRNISDEDVKRFRDTCGGGRKVEKNAAARSSTSAATCSPKTESFVTIAACSRNRYWETTDMPPRS